MRIVIEAETFEVADLLIRLLGTGEEINTEIVNLDYAINRANDIDPDF